MCRLLCCYISGLGVFKIGCWPCKWLVFLFCYFVICLNMCICRVLVKSSRKLAQQYKLTYQEEIPTAQLVQRVANVMQEYTQQG